MSKVLQDIKEWKANELGKIATRYKVFFLFEELNQMDTIYVHSCKTTAENDDNHCCLALFKEQ